MYDTAQNKKSPLADFQLRLISEIFEIYNTTPARTSTGTVHIEHPTRLTGRHFIKKIPTEEGKRTAVRRSVVCSKNNKRKDTTYYCKECNAPLCVLECFQTYHTKKNYKLQ